MTSTPRILGYTTFPGSAAADVVGPPTDSGHLFGYQSSGPARVDGSGKAYDAFFNGPRLVSNVRAGNRYTVSAISKAASATDYAPGVSVRNTIGSDNGIHLFWHSSSVWRLSRYLNGTGTVLTTYAGVTPTTEVLVELETVGRYIIPYFNGVADVPWLEDVLPDPGFPGLSIIGSAGSADYLRAWSVSSESISIQRSRSLRLFAPTAQGIALDSAGNSGDIAAASSYSGSASWSGSNRLLAIDVTMFGPGVTVTAMTYGGAACTLVGVVSTVTSFGRVEQWRICSSDSGAPAAGSNTLSVTLSGSLEFAVSWASYTGVHQTSPTEGFNSAQATNAGSATDASVTVTTVADNCWVHAACTANDTSITAGNTTRNNVSGTLGSGANEDNGSAKTPAGGVAMSYSGMGITTTWAIAGYALRPLAAASLGGFFARWWYDFKNGVSNV